MNLIFWMFFIFPGLISGLLEPKAAQPMHKVLLDTLFSVKYSKALVIVKNSFFSGLRSNKNNV